jgi:hypothetical protein
VTPTSPSWGDVEGFLKADGWREVPGGERGGERRWHVFFEKVLDDGRVLVTHISHSRQKALSPGRFGAILRHELEVSKEEFWACLRSGRPAERPIEVDEPEPTEHEACPNCA